MKKILKRHGYTLIELLAVIIVLAIIALIATPITIKIINRSKDNAAKQSVENYAHAVETEIVAQKASGNLMEDGTYYINNDGNLCNDLDCNTQIAIPMKGKKPSSGVVTIEDSKVTSIVDVYINEKYYNYENGVVTSSDIPKTAGGYDENNNLIVDWDTMISEEYITVSGSEITGKNETKMSTISSLIIPNSITSIGNSAFRDISTLISVLLPNYLVSIGDYAFRGTGITSITIPNSVTSIGKCAFSTVLTSVTFKEGSKLTSIGDLAFMFCESLTSITIPNSVISIGDQAFRYCTSLTSITIPSSVTSIGMHAFDRCESLTSITIPSSVTSIGDQAFNYCTSLESIKVDSDNTVYEDRNSNAIIRKLNNTLLVGCKNTTIPDSVTSIGGYAFYGCTGLTSITIPSSVTSIEDMAFIYCTSLTSITIPSSVTSIGDQAFNYCTSLESIKVDSNNTVYEDRNSNAIIRKSDDTLIVGCKNTTIPDSVTSIENNAFSGCTGLSSITIPESVRKIGRYAFYYCTNLTSVTFEETSGWNVNDFVGGRINIIDSDLSDTKKVATYLKGTYDYCEWTRSSE